MAMLGKLGWRIQKNPKSLLSRILKAKYFPHCGFLEAPIGNNPSYTWRGIYEARDLVRRGTRWKVGEGDNVRMWMDPWLRDDKSFWVTTPMVQGFEDMLVKDFYIPNTRLWDVQVITEVFTTNDAHKILRTKPSPGDTPDSIIWHFSPNGIYTVKSAYNLAMSIIDNRGNTDEIEWSRIWKMKVPPHVKALYWRLCKGWVAVRSKLSRWYPNLSSNSSVCEAPGMRESLWHLFVDCKFAIDCWKVENLWEKIDDLCGEVEDHSELFLRSLGELDLSESERAMSIVWAIWRHRNHVIWEGKRSTAVQVVFSATSFLCEWKNIRAGASREPGRNTCLRWHPPISPALKINVDAAFFEDTRQTGIGMVLRGPTGECIAMRTQHQQGIMEVKEGEAWGVLEAIEWTVGMGIEEAVIETGAQYVRDAVSSNVLDNIVYGDLITMIKRAIANHERYRMVWVNRNANVVAHNLARISRLHESPICWVEPPNIVDGLHDICTS